MPVHGTTHQSRPLLSLSPFSRNQRARVWMCETLMTGFSFATSLHLRLNHSMPAARGGTLPSFSVACVRSKTVPASPGRRRRRRRRAASPTTTRTQKKKNRTSHTDTARDGNPCLPGRPRGGGGGARLCGPVACDEGGMGSTWRFKKPPFLVPSQVPIE
ncbi:hypothetical protein CCM_00690 [Cordyceps militaris CM01]|uniref:Uncharacterized protein n=1 Tax=Cordyceps militaris (strain CM01) TaxID=983644 RepID=G3J5H4_CORMM|nr:uncharacterized protein CCM_00690 [Cordyceps militaris CM01]EGX96035.1 hypothetical protein CCM_00690 [Cordyceps militaris CM01]